MPPSQPPTRRDGPIADGVAHWPTTCVDCARDFTDRRSLLNPAENRIASVAGTNPIRRRSIASINDVRPQVQFDGWADVAHRVSSRWWAKGNERRDRIEGRRTAQGGRAVE